MGAGEIVNRRDQKWRKRERWWDRISWSLSQEKENWQGVKEASVDWTVGVLWGTQRCVPQTMHGRTAAHCGEKYKGQPAKPKSTGNAHSSADGALLGLTHSSINPCPILRTPPSFQRNIMRPKLHLSICFWKIQCGTVGTKSDPKKAGEIRWGLGEKSLIMQLAIKTPLWG